MCDPHDNDCMETMELKECVADACVPIPDILDGMPPPPPFTLTPSEGCPDDVPSSGACVEGTLCEYGKECCCGECYASMQAECLDGEWALMMTEACMHPNCGTTEMIADGTRPLYDPCGKTCAASAALPPAHICAPTAASLAVPCARISVAASRAMCSALALWALRTALEGAMMSTCLPLDPCHTRRW